MGKQIRSEKTRYRRGVMGHRSVMETAIGRKLQTNEFVHHRNGDKLDNRLENLEIIDPVSHGRHHHLKHPLTTVCAVCGLTFTPRKTKRNRTKTCGRSCGNALMWNTRRANGTDKWAR